uniref:SIS domain-containing protein n=1 Tax=Glossina austeni TaxID=7395 RepID=A0A1A9UKA9_GLOAU
MLKSLKVPTFNFIASGKEILSLELKNLEYLHQCINHNFQKVGEVLLNCSGKIVTMGVGKSGYIARKLAATFSSTGNPSFFVHPTEASHGDLGMLSSGDIIIAFSKSGESSEIIVLISFIKHLNIPYICITENPLSTMAKSANASIFIHKTQEACNLGAPTTRGLLGKKLLIRVHDIMRSKNKVPIVNWTCSIFNAIVEIAKKNFGTVVVLNDHKKISDVDFKHTAIKTVMTSKFQVIHPNILASEALAKMKFSNVKFLLVAINNYLLGIVRMCDILHIGMS